LQAVANGNDGKRYLIFDPTDERTPVGNRASYLQCSFGTLAAGSASQVIALPVLPPDANGTERKGSFRLSADGTLTGSVDTRRESFEKDVAHDVPGAVVDSFQYVQPSGLDKPLEVHYKFTAVQYAHSAGPHLLLRPRVVGTHVQAFDDKARTVPIDLGATGRWHDSFDITLPPGLAVDDTPDPIDVDVDFASYHSTVTAKI
jgi:hypothetical protein